MSKKNLIVGVDPSGNFHEGKGTTGLITLRPGTNHIKFVNPITAKDFKSPEAYWQAHMVYFQKLIDDGYNIKLVVEDYLLYENKAVAQSNSRMETSQLIGCIRLWCHLNQIPIKIQPASAVKTRWRNDILEHKLYIKKADKGRGWMANHHSVPINRHCLDAIRHAVHEDMFSKDKEWMIHEL